MRALVDTNVLVYARGSKADSRRDRARAVLGRCAAEGVGVLSTQVLVEAFDVFTRGTVTPIDRASALNHVAGLATAFPVLGTDAQTVLLAGECACRRGLRIFDATLWAAAFVNGVDVILSEDFSHRSEIEGVRFIDPFAADFELSEIGRG